MWIVVFYAWFIVVTQQAYNGWFAYPLEDWDECVVLLGKISDGIITLRI